MSSHKLGTESSDWLPHGKLIMKQHLHDKHANKWQAVQYHITSERNLVMKCSTYE